MRAAAQIPKSIRYLLFGQKVIEKPPRDRLTHVNYCGSQNRAGRSLCPAEARYSHSLIARAPQAAARKYIIICIATLRGSRTLKSHKNPPPENTKNNKKSMQIVVRYNYLYYFWGSDPSKDVNRIAVLVNLRNLLSNSNKRMSRRVVTTPRLVSTSNALRHDGRGPLVL